MKRLLVVAAIAVAGCTPQQPAQKPLPSGRVELARFAVDVDPAAGTFTIRIAPTAVSGGAQPNALVLDSTVVTVANKPSSYFYNNDVNYSLCNADSGWTGKTWGATVRVGSKITSPAATVLSGVYAEVTDSSGVTAQTDSCNMSLAPYDMDGSYGVWSYGTISPGATVEMDWVFRYRTATPFTFTGRIVGAKVELFQTSPMPQVWMADYGVNGMVFASANFIYYVNPSGVLYATSVDVGEVASLATDTVNNRVWWGTTGGLAGYLENDGAAKQTLKTVGPYTVNNIVVDPVNRARAWYTTYDTVSGLPVLNVVQVGSAGPIGTNRPLLGDAIALATGPANYIYVTSGGNGSIEVFDRVLTGAAAIRQFFTNVAPAGCGAAYSLLADPGGGNKMWYSYPAGAGGICTVEATTGAFTKVADALNPLPLCLGPDNNVWYVNNARTAVRVTDTTATPGTTRSYTVGLDPGSTPRGCVRGGGYLWVSGSSSAAALSRIQF
jgi:hypothetical protein